MSIKRFALARSTERPRYPYIGKLRKGGPKGEKRPGKELEWFRFTSEIPAVLEAFTAVYGDEPAAFEITLPNGTPAENWEEWCEKWSEGGILQHRCDGERCVVWYDDKGVYHTAAEGEGPPCPGECSPVGRMAVMLPGLSMEGHVGLVTIETHADHDILAIPRYLAKAYEDILHYGEGVNRKMDLRDILFTVRRVPKMISSPTGGKQNPAKRSMIRHFLVDLVPAASWIKRQMQVISEIQAAPIVTQLPPPDWEDVTSGGRLIGEAEAERDAARKARQAPAPEIVEGEVVEEPTPNGNGGNHLFQDSAVKRSFLRWGHDDKGLSDSDLLTALAVPAFEDFVGTKRDARIAVELWLDAQMAPANNDGDLFAEVPMPEVAR